MAKAKRGLIFSLFSLLFAVAISVTSTYAWFIVNKEVTASNMQVTVKSDTTYLVIAATSALTSDTSFTATASNAEVLPVKYDANESTNSKWKTSVGTGYDDGTSNGTYTSISSADETAGKYFCKYTFYVGLSASSTQAATNLRVKSMTATAVGSGDAATFLPSVSAVVECEETGGRAVNYKDITSITTGDASGQYGNTTSYANLLDSLAVATNGTAVAYKINVYVYIDGDHAVVKSSNAAKLGAFLLSVTFQVS